MEKKTIKKQWENFWYYNKAKTLAGIFIVIILITFTIDIINKKAVGLDVYLLNGNVEPTKTREFEEELIQDLSLTKDHMISIKSLSDEEITADTQTAFQVKLSTGAVDVLILNETEFYSFAKEDAFMELSSKKDFFQNNDAQFLGKSSADTDNLYGIELPQDSILKSLGYDTKNKVIAIMNLSERKENAYNFIKVILE